MRDYYKSLSELDPNSESLSVTVIKGSGAGEKAILSNGKITFLSDRNGFLSAREKDIAALSYTGISGLDGSEIYTELIGHRKDLVVCGCGHVSIPIIKLAKMVDFHVTAIDDREEFIKNAEAAGADECISAPFDEALARIEGNPYTYFVIVTRGHHWDELCLKSICAKSSAYIGAMGSKRRVEVVKQNLLKEGIDESITDSIHAPIGLEIGSDTPEEIAVSIIAEIISIKNRKKDMAFPADILTEITGRNHTPPYPGHMMLSTIIRKEGSAPREAGTKMLVTDDGRMINTIGGGLLEAKIKARCLEILKDSKDSSPKPELLHLALNAGALSEEGEVCGGTVDVLLEKI